MILKMTNKDENFYQYMGKFFGSRTVQRQTNDRIYDDAHKQWYLYLEENEVKAFVSVNKNIIKNIYAIENQYLEKLLKKIKKEIDVTSSIVTNTYLEVYEKCGFQINENQVYKNFVTIYAEKKEN